MIEIFKALSDETRLRILSLIWNNEMCVCEIEQCLNLTQSNASRHLTALKTAGLLLSYKNAQWTYYKLNEKFCESNKQLYDYLDFKLKTLSNYQTDLEKMEQYNKENLCK